MQAYEAQMQRLKLALSVESDNAFAQALAISQGSISGAKKRGQIPHSWFFQVSERSCVSVDWLFFGKGTMHLEENVKCTENVAQSLPQSLDTVSAETPCRQCAKLEKELEDERSERRELNAENRKLWKEIGELREKCGRLEGERYQSSIAKRDSTVLSDAG